MSKYFIIMCLATILSCSKDTSPTAVYQKTFTYQKTSLLSSQGAAMKDNNNYDIIGSKTGNLAFCYDTIVNNYKAFVVSIGSFFINSFTLISSDSIKLNTISSADSISITLPSTENSASGLLIDTAIIGQAVAYDKNNQIINVCVKVFAGFQKDQGNNYYTLFFDEGISCDYPENPNLALNNYITNKLFNKADTVAVYFLNLTYK